MRDRAESIQPAAAVETDEVRTLSVTYDELGERFRLWRDVVNALQTDMFDDWPVEGPRAVMWLMKVFAKAGLTPTLWLERYFAVARWGDADRSAHEMP